MSSSVASRPIAEARRRPVLDFHPVDDEHHAMRGLELREAEAQRREPFGAGAFHELEIVRVVDDAGGVGVLVVNAERKAKGFRVRDAARGARSRPVAALRRSSRAPVREEVGIAGLRRAG